MASNSGPIIVSFSNNILVTSSNLLLFSFKTVSYTHLFRNHMTQNNNALDGDEDGGGLKGDKANAKSYEHNGNKEIGNSCLLYTSRCV